MYTGVSLFLIALGAVLAFAVTATVAGISIQTAGVILMIVGAIGLLMSMLFWSSWAPFASGAGRNETYVREERF